MAELLIKSIDATHDDPDTDRRGCYKRGDVVIVQEDGHEWGRKEGPPKFVRLRIPGAARALAERLVEHQDDDDNGVPQIDEQGAPRTHRRRRWQLDIDNLPAGIRAQLAATGEASITRAQIRARLRRKRDGAQFTDL